MNKDKQIEEIEQFIYDYVDSKQTEKVYLCSSRVNALAKPFVHNKALANALYNAGYRKVPNGAVILTPEERDEELKAYNEKQAKLEAEIYGLKTNYDCLSEHCTNLENKNIAATNEIDSQAKEIERLKADNEALKMWNEAYTEENEKLKKQNADLQKNTAEAIGGMYSGHFTAQEQFAIYVMREIEKIFAPFISKDNNDTENPQ